ncbi:DsbA family protein [Reinekea sp.]|jgi:putative protein-disulfide isomerase|uniref:DsbA family protein n=1 Tax=Reinekea sp. TaxID=1970455 RepID=UPI003989B2EA
MSESKFYYVHDPMCSWCWAHRPQWSLLEQELGKLEVTVQYVVGGLAPDSDVAMPEDQKAAISGYWKKIEAMLGTQFNHDFWTQTIPRRSTYPACRAVIAATWQDAEIDMITALQQAYYLRAMNPSDQSTHRVLAQELELNVDKFMADLNSTELEQAFIEQLNFAHSLPIQGFPSMVMQHNGQLNSIVLDYKDHRGALAQVREVLAQA